MVVTQELIEEVDGLITDKPLILGGDERMPGLAGKARKNLVVLRVQLNIVLVQIFEELFSSEDLGNLHQLVRVAVTVKEGLLPEDHGSEHGSQ